MELSCDATHASHNKRLYGEQGESQHHEEQQSELDHLRVKRPVKGLHQFGSLPCDAGIWIISIGGIALPAKLCDLSFDICTRPLRC